MTGQQGRIVTWKISCGSVPQANPRCDTCSICEHLSQGSLRSSALPLVKARDYMKSRCDEVSYENHISPSDGCNRWVFFRRVRRGEQLLNRIEQDAGLPVVFPDLAC